MIQNNDTNSLDTQFTEMEGIYSIMSERIVEFGKHTDNDFINNDLIGQYIEQQDKILNLLSKYKKQVAREHKIVSKNTSKVEYLTVILLQEKRISELLKKFKGISEKSSELSKIILQQETEESNETEIIFKSNEVITEVKKKLKQSKEFLSINAACKEKYNIDITVDDQFEASIEKGSYRKVITQQHKVLFKINQIYVSISNLDARYKKLFSDSIERDYDFYEEILDKDFLLTLLEDNLKNSYSITNLTNNYNSFDLKGLEKIKTHINQHISLILTLHNLHDIYSEIDKIHKNTEKIGGYVQQLFHRKRFFIESLDTLFPKNFKKYNADNYTGIVGFFARFKYPFGRDNIKLTLEERDAFLERLRGIGIYKLRKEIAYLKNLRKIAINYTKIRKYKKRKYNFINKKFYHLAEEEYAKHKAMGLQDITQLEKTISSYAKPVIKIQEIFTNFQYIHGYSVNYTIAKIKKEIEKSALQDVMTSHEKKWLYLDFQKVYTVEKNKYLAELERQRRSYSSNISDSSYSSSSSSSSSGSSSSSSSSSSRSYSSSGGSSW